MKDSLKMISHLKVFADLQGRTMRGGEIEWHTLTQNGKPDTR